VYHKKYILEDINMQQRKRNSTNGCKWNGKI